MNIEANDKKFPEYMNNITLPEGAKEENIEVYRLCLTGKIEPDSFLTTFVEYTKLFSIRDLDLTDVGSYSMSCYYNINDINRRLKFFNKKNPGIPNIAKGNTEISCGIIQRTRDRKRLSSLKSHVDWWLYDGAIPHEYFRKCETDENS
jgi:hypothetical protein